MARVVYKIVRRPFYPRANYFYSCFEGSFATVYHPMKWARARVETAQIGYHLTVFQSWNHVVEFSHRALLTDDVAIFLAIADGKIIEHEDLPPRSSQASFLFLSRMTKKLIENNDWPAGTIMAEKVALVKEVWDGLHGESLPYTVSLGSDREILEQYLGLIAPEN